MAEVEMAIMAGWTVTVVAKELDASLHGRVEWLRLYVPPRLFALQWLTGRYFIKKAIGGRIFDVVHGHQPQIPDLCDVFQCHFLTRLAFETRCLYNGRGIIRWIDQVQKWIVLHAEDYFYSRQNDRTHFLFVSDLIRNEFARLYRQPRREEVVYNAAMSPREATPEERRTAKAKYLGKMGDGHIVIGYLGGIDERKGYKSLIEAMVVDSGMILLFGGNRSEGFSDERLGDRIVPLGRVDDLDAFYAACDVVIVPSVFDPCPVVVMEAASRGTPVIATAGVGNLSVLLQFGAGLRWDVNTPLGPVVRRIAFERDSFSAGLRSMVKSLSSERFLMSVTGAWESAAGRNQNRARQLSEIR